MFSMESGVVLKYFPAMDSFVKIRVFTEEEISRLMTRANITDKRSYFGLILNACLLHYNDLILPKVPHDDPSVEETLYKLCIEVNPSLDINKVTIPAPESAGGEIHLLEGPKGEPRTVQGLERFRNMEADINRRVIGQEEAVAHISHAIKKSMTGLRDPARPIATFLFVGQTGVGKTEMAKAGKGILLGGGRPRDNFSLARPGQGWKKGGRGVPMPPKLVIRKCKRGNRFKHSSAEGASLRTTLPRKKHFDAAKCRRRAVAMCMGAMHSHMHTSRHQVMLLLNACVHPKGLRLRRRA